jgi:hypothetical protein
MTAGNTERLSKSERDSAKKAAAVCLGKAIDAVDASLVEIGNSFGVSDGRVLKMRSADPSHRDVVPSTADLILADEELYAAWIARIKAERLRRHGPPKVITIEVQAMRSLETDADVQATVSRALGNDGVILPGECPDIERALNRSETERGKLRAMVRAQMTRGE